MSKLVYLPFGYFLFTRLTNVKSFVFHGYYEWLLNVIILVAFQKMLPLMALLSFLSGYLIFIAIYEIGYLVNDRISIKNEKRPRKRLENIYINYPLFIAMRVACVVGVFLVSHELWNQLDYLAFLFLLAFNYLLHNLISSKGLKILTFLILAICRFFLPVYPFLDVETFVLLLFPILLNYVLFRLLIYMDSKDILVMEERKSAKFSLHYYLFLISPSLFISYITGSYIPIAVNIYFLIFVVIRSLSTSKISNS